MARSFRQTAVTASRRETGEKPEGIENGDTITMKTISPIDKAS